MLPFADGLRQAPSLIDRDSGAAAKLSLQSVSRLENDLIHIRYLVEK